MSYGVPHWKYWKFFIPFDSCEIQYLGQKNFPNPLTGETVCLRGAITPITLKNFIATNTSHGVQLQWHTATETNNKLFVVERSTNNHEFIPITQIKATNINNSSYTYTYKPTRNEQQETLYYRLKQIDFDGKYSYSEVKKVEFKIQNLKFNIFPNPAKDYITIKSEEGIKEVKLLNTLGQVVRQQNCSNATKSLLWRVGEAKGFYMLQVITTMGEVWNEKLVVE